MTQWEVRDCEAPNTWRDFNIVQNLDSLGEKMTKLHSNKVNVAKINQTEVIMDLTQVRFGGCSDTLWFRPQQVCFSKIRSAQLHKCKEMGVL